MNQAEIGMLILYGISFLVAIWVFIDAKRRERNLGAAFRWALGTFLMIIIALPYWLIQRPQLTWIPEQKRNIPHEIMPAEDITEKIVKKYGKGILVRRGIAMWVDFVVLYVGIGLFIHILMGEEVANKFFQQIGRNPFYKIYIWIWPILVYYAVLEGLSGFTVGKFLFRIKVVNAMGITPGLRAAGLRTILRLIEVNPILLGGLPAYLIAASSKKKQRLGDIIAKTYVIYKNDIKHWPKI